MAWYIELHAGRNTKWNENWTHVFGMGGNIAVGAHAVTTNHLFVHGVKKLSLHTGAIRLWLDSVVDLINLHNAKDWDKIFYSFVYLTTWILCVYIINLCLWSTGCIIRFLVTGWGTGSVGACYGMCTPDSPRWPTISKCQKYFAEETKVRKQVDPAIAQLTSTTRLQ